MNVMKFHDYFIDISVTSREYHGISQWIQPQLLYIYIYGYRFGLLLYMVQSPIWLVKHGISHYLMVLINASRTEADPLIACGAGDQAVTWRWVQAEKYGDFHPWFSHERLVVAIYPWLTVTLNHEKWRLTKILMVFSMFISQGFGGRILLWKWHGRKSSSWNEKMICECIYKKKARFPMPYYISVQKKWGTP